MDRDELSVRRFKMLQTRCIAALAEKYSDFYFELLPEIEVDLDEDGNITLPDEKNEAADLFLKYAVFCPAQMTCQEDSSVCGGGVDTEQESFYYIL